MSKESISVPLKTSAVDLKGSTLAKNTIISFVGMGIPYLVGFFAIPFIIRGLGVERFGILSLIWIIIGYFSFVDLGLSRATTKYVAESLGRGEVAQIPHYVWTTVIMQCMLGLVGSLLFLFLTPIIVEKILNIPPQLVGETKSAFFVIGLSLPIILLSSSFRGVLEAAQKFGPVNVIKIPVSSSLYLLPLIGYLLGFRLPGIVLLLVAARLFSLVAWFGYCLKVFPELKARILLHKPAIRTLLRFGGWVSLSSILFNIISSLDRLLIGSLLTVKDVGYYTAPLEVVNRFGIIPGSLSLILFPAFSSLHGGKEGERLKDLFARSVKYIILGVGPIAIVFVFYAKPFLGWWLGQDFIRNSTLVFQVLTVGFMVSSLSHIPYSFLQGIGRVALVTKLQFAELGFYLPMAWIFIKLWGIRGAALAFALKCIFVTTLNFGVTWKVHRVKLLHFREARIGWSLLVLLILTLSLYGVKIFHLGLPGLLGWAAFLGALSYVLVLSNDEKDYLKRIIRRRSA